MKRNKYLRKRQEKVPLFDVVFNHAKRRVVSFHTPGHKNGQGVDQIFKKFVGKNFFYMDVTVFPEVDSLHDPRGPIKEAQELVAEAYGVKNSFFLVNGSTVGNEAMFLSACNPGDSVIISRNAHKSVMSAIVLSGVWPIWLQPEIDSKLDILLDSSPEQIENAIKKFPEVKAVFITSPTYNGVSTNLVKIVEIVRRYNKIILLDEAHGPHLRFHEKLPLSGVDAKVDLTVQSVHKILSGLSQGSVLHFNSDIVDLDRVKKIVSLLQTTSPNYIILASMDLARRQMFFYGEQIISKLINYAVWARKRINCLDNIYCFYEKDLKQDYTLDVLKLTINVTGLGLTGYEVESILSKKYNIQVDCADLFNLIALMGMGTSKRDVQCLVEALGDIDRKNKRSAKSWDLQLPSLSTEMVMMPREVVLLKKSKRVSLKKAAGHICAETLTPYPPGIPILIPGERVTREICRYLEKLSQRGISVSGQDAKILNTIKVVSN
ncbi:aminotransferase class I/II-fold pyridoxal phosphate-dependent enzyme [bacterium]|nr:aminotransferase class I/II-fold pyridoxal phosphate-dependent enzyme [bacterium]